jgi:hypothetical protein
MTVHDKLASIVGAEMLSRWQKRLPGWNHFGPKIRSTKPRNSFPSPDISFWDETNGLNIQCEFKPPKEEDRTDTVHTGTGQSIVYLHPSLNADVTFLIVPKYLYDGFDVTKYLTPFFKQIIHGKLPIGLVLYDPKDPSQIEMACAPDLGLIGGEKGQSDEKKSAIKVKKTDICLKSHDETASIVGAEMLSRWQKRHPGWEQFGPDIRPYKPRNSFPSPNISFLDATNGLEIQCKFKSMGGKRDTISNGIGQSIGYLHPVLDADVTFLIVPKYLDSGYDVGDFLTTFYETVIEGVLPAGLILYDPEEPSRIEMACAPEPALFGKKMIRTTESMPVSEDVGKRKLPAFHTNDRYWAKWCDMSTSELHRILHYANLCKKKHKESRKIEIISSTWKWLIGPPSYLEERDPHVFWAPSMGETLGWKKKKLSDGSSYPGKPIVKGSKKRSAFLKKVEKGDLSRIDAENQFSEYLNEQGGNSPMYRVIYKNNFMTLDHLQLWDGSYFLNDSGIELLEIGDQYGSNSPRFIDALAWMMLTTGKHIRLIKDLHLFTKGNRFSSSDEAINAFVVYYAGKNLIRFNEESKTKGKGGTKPLKYEILIWKKLGLLSRKTEDSDINGWVKNRGFRFNAERINRLIKDYKR